MKLKQALKLPKKELDLVRGSFDVIGDIAIIEVPLELKKRKQLIGKTLFDMLKNVKVVAVKEGGHKGKYRRQKLTIVAGEKRKETEHKESGLRFKLDVEKCYYSPRLVTERMRIAMLVKKNEKVLVVGSGVAPYPLVLAKHSRAKEITGVEVNPIAHKYAKENLNLNKIQNVKLVKGDICKIKLGKFDRIICMIPYEGVEFTENLLRFAKKGTTLHIYDFAPQENLKEASDNLKAVCAVNKRKCRILRVVKAGQHAVRRYRVCVDAKIN